MLSSTTTVTLSSTLKSSVIKLNVFSLFDIFSLPVEFDIKIFRSLFRNLQFLKLAQNFKVEFSIFNGLDEFFQLIFLGFFFNFLGNFLYDRLFFFRFGNRLGFFSLNFRFLLLNHFFNFLNFFGFFLFDNHGFFLLDNRGFFAGHEFLGGDGEGGRLWRRDEWFDLLENFVRDGILLRRERSFCSSERSETRKIFICSILLRWWLKILSFWLECRCRLGQ